MSNSALERFLSSYNHKKWSRAFSFQHALLEVKGMYSVKPEAWKHVEDNMDAVVYLEAENKRLRKQSDQQKSKPLSSSSAQQTKPEPKPPNVAPLQSNKPLPVPSSAPKQDTKSSVI